jgi:lipopolysaccharide biosynthesis protein
MNKKQDLQFLAYYLPQYHPIPENDAWWGKGFTEWTNVTKAKPLFKGHYQPILPADLGFYDLRVPEVQEAQSEMALQYGIDGFIYYQYWFGKGKMLLEKPAEAMLKNKNIKIPFCFCWANESWKGIWHGLDNPNTLIEQSYDGEEGYIAYFNYLLPFFQDDRYIKVDNKPMFHIYKLDDIPNLDVFINTFQTLAKKHGFDGIYLIATHGNSQTVLNHSNIYGQVDVTTFTKMRNQQFYMFQNKTLFGKIERILFEKFAISLISRKPFIIDYEKAVKELSFNFTHEKLIPCVFPNWDNSARVGKKALIFHNASPKIWGNYLSKIIELTLKTQKKNKMIVIKSWNEWAEGNYLEPDRKFGLEWLQIFKSVKDKYNCLI